MEAELFTYYNSEGHEAFSPLVLEGCGVPTVIFLASLPASWLWMQVQLWESCSGAG